MGQVTDAWPLAQRTTELEAFRTALSRPDSTSFLLYGRAGVGKSRLADECRTVAATLGHPVARVVASHAAASLPLGALAPVLPMDLGSLAAPAEIFARTRALFEESSDGARLVLLVDDAHLLDNSSAVLLTQLQDVGAVFVVATIRDGEALPDAVAGWWRNEAATRIDLEDLDRTATGDLLALALDGRVGSTTVQRLHSASGGNPLLLRELVVQAHESGQLTDASGAWQIAGLIPVSRRLSDLLATRLKGISAEVRAALDVLAVCGALGPAEFPTPLGVDGTEALEASGLVRVTVEGHRYQLAIAHPLFSEVLRSDLSELKQRTILLAAAESVEALGTRRREDARRVATWRLDAGGVPDADLVHQAARVARFAHDYVQVERLARVLRDAGPVAEATVLLGEALYELGSFDESEAVLSVVLPDHTPSPLLVQQATLRAKNLQWGLCNWPAALAVVQEARATLDAASTEELTAEEGSVRMFSGRPQEAIDVLEALDPTAPRVRILKALAFGPSLASVGRTSEAIATSAAAFEEHLKLADPLGLAHPGTHLVNQAFSLVEAGRFADSDALALAGHEVAVNDHIPIAQIWFSLVLARSMSLRGRYREALRWAQEGASTGRLHGFRGPLRIALSAQAAADAVLGNVSAAQAAVAEMDQLPPFGFLHHEQIIGPAWAASASGDPARARAMLTAEATAAVESVNRGTASWLWHDAARLGAKGTSTPLLDLAARSDSPLLAARAQHAVALDADDAEALAEASATLEALGLVLLAAEAAWSASDAARREGRQREAAGLARRASELAHQCNGVQTPGLDRPDAAVPLTAREREVATLAMQGLSSPEIGERLFVAVRTVDNHLQKAYAKLGINRRDQLAEAMQSR